MHRKRVLRSAMVSEDLLDVVVQSRHPERFFRRPFAGQCPPRATLGAGQLRVDVASEGMQAGMVDQLHRCSPGREGPDKCRHRTSRKLRFFVFFIFQNFSEFVVRRYQEHAILRKINDIVK